jgi:hypothetical protein
MSRLSWDSPRDLRGLVVIAANFSRSANAGAPVLATEDQKMAYKASDVRLLRLAGYVLALNR